MSDIFREVDEELRTEKAQRIWKRFGPFIIGAALLVVAGTAGYSLWQRMQATQQQERTAVLGRVVETATATQAPSAEELDRLNAAVAELRGDHATLGRLYQADALARAGRVEEAVAAYQAIAGTPGDTLLRDLAALKAILHQIDSGDPAQLQGQLAPLAAPGSPYRWSAQELLGLLALRTGDTARAGTIFQELSADAGAPAGIRARATELAALHAESK